MRTPDPWHCRRCDGEMTSLEREVARLEGRKGLCAECRHPRDRRR